MAIVVEGITQIDEFFQEALTTIVEEEATTVDSEIKSKAAALPGYLEVDDQVEWDFKRTWRNGVPKKRGTPFGSDYGYWGAVLHDAVALFQRIGRGQSDPKTWDLRRSARTDKQQALRAFMASYPNQWMVFENLKPTTLAAPLTGPLVEFGPTLDNALFMEGWDTGNGPNIPIYQAIGVVHAVAYQLQRMWRGVHAIYPTAVKPSGATAHMVRKPGRQERIERVPIIGIATRHRGNIR